jgi:hypothetical protein
MKKLKLVTLTVVLMGLSFSGNSYCLDRDDRGNSGYCTEDPDYHGGAQFCKPGGFTCDGDTIFPPTLG